MTKNGLADDRVLGQFLEGYIRHSGALLREEEAVRLIRGNIVKIARKILVSADRVSGLDSEYESDVERYMKAEGKRLEPNKDKRFVRSDKGFVGRQVGVLKGIVGKMALGEGGLMGSMKKLDGISFTKGGVGKTEMNHKKKASSERHGELWLRICNGLRSNPVLRNVCDGKEFETSKKEFVRQKTKQVKNIKKELKSEEAVTNGKPSKKPAPKPSYAEGANPLKLAERASS